MWGNASLNDVPGVASLGFCNPPRREETLFITRGTAPRGANTTTLNSRLYSDVGVDNLEWQQILRYIKRGHEHPQKAYMNPSLLGGWRFGARFDARRAFAGVLIHA